MNNVDDFEKILERRIFAWLGYVVALCISSMAAISHGAVLHSYEDDGATLVMTVDSGTEAMDASWVTSPDSGTQAAVTNVVKRGAGTLVSAALSAYEGDFSVEGGVLSVAAEGDLGKTGYANTVRVRDSASILFAVSVKSSTFYSNKHIVVSGGKCATANAKIVVDVSAWCCIGTNMLFTLEDDADLFVGNNRARFHESTFDLGGNTLTVFCTGEWHYFEPDNCIFKNGGKVVANEKVSTVVDQSTSYTMTFLGTGALELNSVFRPHGVVSASGWTMYATNNTGLFAGSAISESPTCTSRVAWDGPLVLGRNVRLATHDGKNNASNTVLNLKGPISGSGTISGGPGWINLHSPSNTYSGAVTVTGKSAYLDPGSGGIGIWNGASCFTNASSITLKDGARLEFMDDVAGTVGRLTFTGDDDQSIKGGAAASRSTIAGFTKTGAGVLSVDSAVHVTAQAMVSNGVLRIPLRDKLANSGLCEYRVKQLYKYAYSQAWGMGYDAFDPAGETFQETLNAEYVGVDVTGTYKVLNPSADTWGARPEPSGDYSKWGYWYHGYIWNHSNAPVTWRIGSTSYYGVYVTFSGATAQRFNFHDYNHSSGVYASVGEVTLQPGATQIDIVAWTQSSNPGWRWDGGRQIKLPLSYCTDLSWDIDGVTCAYVATNAGLKALFHPLENAVDAAGRPLFTTTDTLEGEVLLDDQPVFDDLAFAAGTVFDLGGNRVFQVRKLTGSPAVTNVAVFGITNNWTICAADFPKGGVSAHRPMTVDGKLVFAPGATFSIDDETAIERKPRGIVVATAAGGVQGVPSTSLRSGRWALSRVGNEVRLGPSAGLAVMIR